MIYPKNIFSTEPQSNSIRPFIIFLMLQPNFNVTKAKSWFDEMTTYELKTGFVLPFPEGGLVDSQSHTYSDQNPIANMAIDKLGLSSGAAVSDAISMVTGLVPDPMVTQIYRGSTPRKWSGTWQIVPQSLGEAALVALLLANLKKYASPDKWTLKGKVGALIQPCVIKMYFSNPLIHNAMNFNYMAIESYSINWFAQGYASTYRDMMPKHIELQLNLAEFGIKYREEFFGIGGNTGINI